MISEIPLYVYFIGLSSIIGFLFYHRNKDLQFLKFFPYFLLISFTVETAAIYLWYTGRDTASLYNFFSLFEFGFYFYVFFHLLKNKIAKQIIVIGSLTFLPASLINIFFIQGIFKLHTITYSIGCLLIIGLSIYYYLELFSLPKFIVLTRQPAFWIVSGLLFFYCCSFPYFAFLRFLEGSAPFIIDNFDKIINILNVLLYSLFSIAFLCRIKVKTST